MPNPWFKFYGGEYLSDPKMDALDGNERSIWLTTLCLSNQTEDGVIKYTTEEKIIEKAGVPKAQRDGYVGTLQKFIGLQMLQLCNGNVTDGIKPINWEKRQYSEGLLRVKKHREKISNGFVTPLITTDKKREEKNRKEKNITAGGITPAQEAREFFTSLEKQTQILLALQNKFGQKDLMAAELKKFIDYWTEPNKSGTRQRWEQQPTFELRRRITTWLNNIKSFTKQPVKAKGNIVL